jgi:hypothetical protein
MRSDDDFPDIDTTTASAARMYDYALGGTDNYPVDRQAVEALADMDPRLFSEPRSNRRYLERLVRHLAGECGIQQFIDIGSGLPTQQNVHQVAQAVSPGARVVYVDNDAVVLRHQKVSALQAEDGSTAFLLEDARNVDRILDHPDTKRLIDFGEPVAVLYLSFLHLIPDADDPWGMVRRMLGRLVPGSYLAVSHVVSDDAAARQKYTEFFVRATGGHFGRVREKDEVRAFFDGLEIVDPGLVHVAGWRAEVSEELRGLDFFEYGGLGRNPA